MMLALNTGHYAGDMSMSANVRFRDSESRVDAVATVLILAVVVLVYAFDVHHVDSRPHTGAGLGLIIAGVAAFNLRRRWPRTALFATTAALVGQGWVTG